MIKGKVKKKEGIIFRITGRIVRDHLNKYRIYNTVFYLLLVVCLGVLFMIFRN